MLINAGGGFIAPVGIRLPAAVTQLGSGQVVHRQALPEMQHFHAANVEALGAVTTTKTDLQDQVVGGLGPGHFQRNVIGLPVSSTGDFPFGVFGVVRSRTFQEGGGEGRAGFIGGTD